MPYYHSGNNNWAHWIWWPPFDPVKNNANKHIIPLYTLHISKEASFIRTKKKKKLIITCPQLNPSITSWWALAISFRLLVWLNCSDMSYKIVITVRKPLKYIKVDHLLQKKRNIELDRSPCYLAKSISSTTGWNTPTTPIIWVRP